LFHHFKGHRQKKKRNVLAIQIVNYFFTALKLFVGQATGRAWFNRFLRHPSVYEVHWTIKKTPKKVSQKAQVHFISVVSLF